MTVSLLTSVEAANVILTSQIMRQTGMNANAAIREAALTEEVDPVWTLLIAGFIASSPTTAEAWARDIIKNHLLTRQVAGVEKEQD